MHSVAIFKFSLQTLKEVKEKDKDDVVGRLIKAQDHLNMLVENLNNCMDKRQKAYTDYQAVAAKGTTCSYLDAYNQYASVLSKEIISQQSLIYDAERNIDTIKDYLISVHKDIKVLDKLKEKQLREYNLTVAKANEKELEQLMAFNAAISEP